MLTSIVSKGVIIMRVNLNINEDLVAEIDKLAKAFNLSRSAYVSMSLSKHLKQEKLIEALPELLSAIKKEQAKQLTE